MTTPRPGSSVPVAPARSARPHSIRCLGLVLSMLLGATLLRAEKLVTVAALAESGYLRHRSESNPPKPESYVFVQGQHSVGADSSLKKIGFPAIASTLAGDLLKQRYEPADNVSAADLVIVVHWGMTGENDKLSAMAQYEPDTMRRAADAVAEARAAEAADGTIINTLGTAAAAEANYRNEQQIARSLYAGNDLVSSSNADLLGFRAAMTKDDDTGDTLRSMNDEERYFVILMAYDGPAMIAGKKQLLWSTRASLRAAGVNFTLALDRMSSVAARYHGTKPPTVVLENATDRPRAAKAPDPKIIEVPATSRPKPAH